MKTNEVKALFLKQGFIESSIVHLKSPMSIDLYKAQVASRNTGSMEFLKTHYEEKKSLHKKYKTALVGLYPYYPFEDELKSSLKISIYARQKDYHLKLKEKLDQIVDSLKRVYPDEEFFTATDSKPILERDLAFQAGLGWVGKNTCLIHKSHGSLFFIAEVLTSLDFNTPKTLNLKSDHCGTCTRCLEACPTGALSPHKLEVEKCISYRNIEKKDSSSDVLKAPLDSWFFGCDICQSVCPWNEKTFGKENMRSLEEWAPTEESTQELKDILMTSNKSLDKKFASFPLSRARGKRLKRNALQIIFENKLKEFESLLADLDLGELNDLKEQVQKSLNSSD